VATNRTGSFSTFAINGNARIGADKHGFARRYAFHTGYATNLSKAYAAYRTDPNNRHAYDWHDWDRFNQMEKPRNLDDLRDKRQWIPRSGGMQTQGVGSPSVPDSLLLRINERQDNTQC